MKKAILIKGSLLAIVMLVFMVAPALATKPGETVNPNGFPSGEHYNLNIIGKKLDFVCPPQEFYWQVTEDNNGDGDINQYVESCDEGDVCVETDIPIYGNVVFVPENGEDIEIYMQSGRKGGKKAEAITELQAIDPCAEAFDGDAAVIQLPPNENGYDVYARALAKPTDNPHMIITPDLIAVEDESGNDLIYLGLVTDRGFVTPDKMFTRMKGKSTAVKITGLFEWSGDVCYLTSDYCDPIEECTTKLLCCTDEDEDGVYESCELKTEDLCPVDTIEVTAYCKTYEEKWVFNIGDFVTYLWSVDNHGLKLLQVRFYPIAE